MFCVHTNRSRTVSNPAFPMSGLETLCWKQAFPRHVPVETVRFQPSVSNVGVGNTGLETGVSTSCARGNGPSPTQRFQCRGWKHCVGNSVFLNFPFIFLVTLHFCMSLGVSNPPFSISVFEASSWKQAFPRHAPVGAVHFQPTVSNPRVGNIGCETMVFRFVVAKRHANVSNLV